MKNSPFFLMLQRALLASWVGLAATVTATETTDVFLANLSGDEEVPTRDTRGRGVTVLRLSPDGTELYYRLVVANIQNVVAAHIHVAPAGVNGPVIAFLAGNFPPGGGSFSGVLAEGTITAADLVGPLLGLSLGDLVDAMKAGDTYVNVHTNDGVAPTNTGPGDFPGGEIRGQIQDVGATGQPVAP